MHRAEMLGAFLLPYWAEREMRMRETINETIQQPRTEYKEVKIGKTIYQVNSVFGGGQQLDKLLLDWAVKKTLAASNC